MTDVFAPVREARRLWERTAPQLTLDVDDEHRSAVEELVAREPHKLEVAGSSPARALLPDAGSNGARSRRLPLTAGSRPAVPSNDNGHERAPVGASALVASQETS